MADVMEELRSLPAHTGFLLETLPFERRTRIMDIGANPASRPAYMPLAEGGGAEVHGFQPSHESFARLEAKEASNEVYYPFAVGHGGERRFYDCQNASFSSLYAPDAQQIATLGHWANSVEVTQERMINAIALDDVEDMAHPDLLKMDSQGAELEVLQSAARTLSEAVVIMPQLRFFRLYQGEPMMGELDQQLRDMGFMLHKILPGVSVRLTSSRISRLRPAMTRNQTVDADAIYIRDLAHAGTLTEQQLCHLALLSDSVLTSIDVTLRCLDLLAARGVLKPEDIDRYIDTLPANFRVAEE